MSSFICPECGDVYDEAPDLMDHRALVHKVGRVVGSRVSDQAALTALNARVDSLTDDMTRTMNRVTAIEGALRTLGRAMDDLKARVEVVKPSQVVPVAERISAKEREFLERLMKGRPAGSKGED